MKGGVFLSFSLVFTVLGLCCFINVYKKTHDNVSIPDTLDAQSTKYTYVWYTDNTNRDNTNKNLKVKDGTNNGKNGNVMFKNLKQPSLSVINVDASTNISAVEKFWKSTGFCPPKPHQDDASWFLSPDMSQNLVFLGGLPFDGIKQVRIHWLLDCVKNEFPVYDFTKLDAVIELLTNNGLNPGFEIMGNPSNYFNNFENVTQIAAWRMLIFQTVQRYIDLYGIESVSTWNFETWNEPKLNHFDGLNFTLQGFFNYYDATRDALKAASAEIRFGGPGGECHQYDLTKSYCWGLLNHVVHGRNILTGQSPPGIDFISIHKKGEEPNNTEVIFQKELEFQSQLKNYFPELLTTPKFNDEGDPLVGWSKDKWWRADVTYAAMVAKVIIKHQNLWISRKNNTFNLKLFSNDNGFLSYNPYFFTQRTLLARFQMNNTNPPHVQFIRKPVYSVMGMLSYLGETQLKTEIDVYSPNHVGLLATYHKGDDLVSPDSNQIAILVYSSVDTDTYVSETNVSLNLRNIKGLPEMQYVVYRLDKYYTNPYHVWIMAGKPKTPNFDTFSKMREQEDPLRVLGPTPSSTEIYFQLNITVPLPGVALIHLCSKASSPPDQVTDVNILNITSGQILIAWSDSCVHSKCIKTYEVEFSLKKYSSVPSITNRFERLNHKDTVFNTFVYATNYSDVAVSGSYRIRAIDYWNRTGEYSLVVNYP